MGLFRSKTPVTATFADTPITCVICAGEHFLQREVKLNTSNMEFFDLGWANASALGLICIACGYVHEFAGSAIQLWEPSDPDPHVLD